MVTPDAPPRFAHQIIRASAGTGKTFSLSNRYLRLLIAGAECQTILATTFSRKGAGEILDRIMGRLSDAALDDKAAARLSGELAMPLSRQQAAETLHQVLSNLHRLEVSTLDSFFNRVAKAFSLELGLPPTWEIVDEQQIARMVDQSIEQVLRDSAVATLLHMLSKGEATRRVASMIRDVVRDVYTVFRESGPGPWDAIQPAGQRLTDDQLVTLIGQMESVVIPTKQLSTHWEKVVAAVREQDWMALIAMTSFQNMLDGNPKYSRTKLPEGILESYQRLIPHCRAIVSEQLIARNEATRDLLSAFGDWFERAKQRSGSLRFDDVTERLQAVAPIWDSERFSFRLDHQIQHLLLDEFQDTSPAQWNVIRPFAERIVSTDTVNRSFFCVGDMKQAIFGWRGGVAEIFDLVDRNLPDLEHAQLAKSYRSSPEVIQLVNQVFGRLDQYQCDDPLVRSAVARWSDWFTEHSTAKDFDGYVSVEMAADGDKARQRHAARKDRDRNERVTEATVDRVRQLARELPDSCSIGVLVRTNREIGDLIFRLQLKGVDVSEEGGSPLTDSAAVELILSTLQLADHPGDGLARFHLSHSPLAGVFDLQPETDSNQSTNLAAVPTAAARFRQRWIEEGVGPVIESLARTLVDRATTRERQRLQQLVRVAYEQATEDAWQLRPSRFAQFVREEVKVAEESNARVRVMTIHRSKGLEFDAVVIPMPVTSDGWAGQPSNVVTGRPSPTEPIDVATRYVGSQLRKLLSPEIEQLFAADREQKIRESMCVMYVALTRAVRAVHLVLSFGAKPDHQSPAGVILSTLCPDAKREAGVLYQSGNAGWHSDWQRELDQDPYDLKRFQGIAGPPPQRKCIPRDLRSGRGRPRLSPSARTDPGRTITLASRLESSDDAALDRGVRIHACFEHVVWLDEGVPTREELRSALQSLAGPGDRLDRDVDAFYACLDQPGIQKLFSRHAYQVHYLGDLALPDDLAQEATRLVVETERRFAVLTDAGLMQGVIDRLVTVFRGSQLIAADIIDLKTDRIEGDRWHPHVARYRPQLRDYRMAAANFLGLPVNRIATRLAFLDSGRIVNVDAVEGRAESQPGSDPPLGLAGPKRPPKPRSSGPERSRPDSAADSKSGTGSPRSPVQRKLWDD